MGEIFINYRREDSIGTAGRLHDRLAQAFGRETIFMDVDHIPAGVDFVEHLNSKVAACKVLLVVIGPNWLNAKDEAGQRRLEKPDDFVSIEIEAALVRDIRVIPVLVEGADIPKPSELPDSLKRLARRQGVEVRHNHFGRDADALIEKVREALGGAVWGRRWRWMTAASATAALLLAGSIALFWIWAPPTIETMVPQAEAIRDAEEAGQQRLAAVKAEEEKAKAAAEAEAQRKSQEAEQQRLAAAKAEEERKAKAAADAEAQRQSREAEQQRLAAAKAEEERKAKAAAEAEAQRKSREAEQQRLAAAKAEEERKAKAAAEAEAQRKSREAEQQRLAAAKAEEERKATQEAQRAGSAAAGFQIIKNLAVEGDDYRRLDATIESCSSACAGDARCKMFAYWQNGVCYLFDKDFGTYPQVTSQVGFVRVSPKQAAQEQPPAAGASIVYNVAVKGDEYLRIRDTTIKSCSSACAGDSRCKIFAYWQNGVCYLFDKDFGTYPQVTSQVGRVR